MKLDPQHKQLYHMLKKDMDEQTEIITTRITDNLKTSIQSIINSSEKRTGKKIDMLSKLIEDINARLDNQPIKRK